MARVLELIENVLAQLSSANWAAAAVAVLVHVVNVVVRTRAWRNIVAVAYPGALVSWPRIFAAYAAGAGVNAVLPWRGGDVLRLAVAKRAVPGSTYPGLASTILVESLFNAAVGACLFAAAVGTGAVPGVRVTAANAGLFALLLATPVLVARRTSWGRRLAGELIMGARVLRRPSTYLSQVASWQALDWVLRLLTIALFMGAFGLGGGLGAILLVQTVQSASGLIPAAPARIGAKHALLFYALGSQVPPSSVLAFVAGSELLLVSSNAALGVAALTALLGRPRWRQAPAAA